MPCPSENDLLAFVERILPRDRREALERHLGDCKPCRSLAALVADPAADADGPSSAGSSRDANSRPAHPRSLAARLSHAQAMQHIGTTLSGKWSIDSLIGSGGMSHVFAGRHRNGRAVAIKVLRPDLALVPELVRRFLREGYVANHVAHPGAVAVLDDDITTEGVPFLVMELLEGETLKASIARRGALPPAEVFSQADDLLAVLEAAHARGVVHRDVKPDNLFVTTAGELKVLDFGIARLRDATRAAEGEDDTRDGQMLGTPGYMAPEQARGTAVDPRTDVWASAATIFAMLAGHPLRRAESAGELVRLATTTAMPPTHTLSKHIPGEVGRVLDRALAFEPDQRFANATAFRQALAAIVTPHATKRSTAWRSWTALGIALVLASLGGIFIATIRVTPPPESRAADASSFAPTRSIPLPVEGPTPDPPRTAGDTREQAALPPPRGAPRATASARPLPSVGHEDGAAQVVPARSAPEEAAPPASRRPERDPLGPRR